MTTKWPQPLRDYVSRCFQHYDGDDRPALESWLKKVITTAYESGAVDQIDWSTKLLPWEEPPLMSMSLPKVIGVQQQHQQHRKYDLPSSRGTSGGYTTSRDSEITPIVTETGKKKRRLAGEIVVDDDLLAKRARRFDAAKKDTQTTGTMTMTVPQQPPPVQAVRLSETDAEEVPTTDVIVGLSEKLEKSYLRLTSAPDPRNVRPVPVLRRTLELLKDKWRSGSGENYGYVCDQFKSMRQDLTVQHVRDGFTCQVYETHGRISLEKNDLGEYNQCQTQLQQLYRELGPHVGRQHEFLAYRLLYLLHTRNTRDIDSLVGRLTTAERHDPAVQHALAVRRAVTRGNYAALFRLHDCAPNMGGYLMDQFIDRERVDALVKISRAYRPTIPFRDLSNLLGLPIEAIVPYLTDLGYDASTNTTNTNTNGSGAGAGVLDTKNALPAFESYRQRLVGKGVDIKGQI